MAKKKKNTMARKLQKDHQSKTTIPQQCTNNKESNISVNNKTLNA